MAFCLYLRSSPYLRQLVGLNPKLSSKQRKQQRVLWIAVLRVTSSELSKKKLAVTGHNDTHSSSVSFFLGLVLKQKTQEKAE
jgi:hypothetical protein